MKSTSPRFLSMTKRSVTIAFVVECDPSKACRTLDLMITVEDRTEGRHQRTTRRKLGLIGGSTIRPVARKASDRVVEPIVPST